MQRLRRLFLRADLNEQEVRLMRGIVGDALGVKASGGIRDWDTALAMIAAGANRIGASSGVALLTGAPASGTGY